jgi:hypothetical protein
MTKLWPLAAGAVALVAIGIGTPLWHKHQVETRTNGMTAAHNLYLQHGQQAGVGAGELAYEVCQARAGGRETAVQMTQVVAGLHNDRATAEQITDILLNDVCDVNG